MAPIIGRLMCLLICALSMAMNNNYTSLVYMVVIIYPRPNVDAWLVKTCF